MIEYSTKIFNEQYGFKKKIAHQTKNKKLGHLSRPKSFDKSHPASSAHSPTLEVIKKKVDSSNRSVEYSKTVGVG